VDDALSPCMVATPLAAVAGFCGGNGPKPSGSAEAPPTAPKAAAAVSSVVSRRREDMDMRATRALSEQVEDAAVRGVRR
jgi:hypothetical protein